MNKPILLSTLALFVILQIHLGDGLKCYQCNSKEQENCEDLKGTEYLMDCGDDGEKKDSSIYVVCRKMDQWVDFKVLGQEPFKSVVRQCGKIKDSKACIYKAGLGARVNICECEGEGCNGANHLSILPATFLLALVSFIYSKF